MKRLLLLAAGFGYLVLQYLVLPAQRRHFAFQQGDLVHQALEVLVARLDDLAVGVRQQPRPRGVGRDRAGELLEVLLAGEHVLGVERAGDAERR